MKSKFRMDQTKIKIPRMDIKKLKGILANKFISGYGIPFVVVLIRDWMAGPKNLA